MVKVPLAEIAKKVPWWGWVVAVIVVILLWQTMTGWAMARKYYGMMLDQLRDDQSRVIEVLEENMKDYEQQILDLQKQIEANKKSQASVRAENERLKIIIGEKNAQILALEREREAITVPRDPDKLVGELHRMGYRTARVRRSH